ncbi:hypothetical protein ACFYT4_17155 [Streptomyces sp. NPDC004609]|uniref:hypothetical protein n=1 Tax=Streptomyces sp. NPDC004609 TaxID=3364704 RepID=UPI0036793592
MMLPPMVGTPLCAAAWWGHTEAARELLESGADPGRREDAGEGRSPQEWATAGDHPEIAALLQGSARPPPNGLTGPTRCRTSRISWSL